MKNIHFFLNYFLSKHSIKTPKKKRTTANIFFSFKKLKIKLMKKTKKTYGIVCSIIARREVFGDGGVSGGGTQVVLQEIGVERTES